MRILLVTSRYPLPPWRGNQVRTVEWLDALAEHEVTLVCPEPDPGSAGEIAAELHPYSLGLLRQTGGLFKAAIAGLPFQEGLYDSRVARRSVAATVERARPDVMILQMVRCAWAYAAAVGSAPGLPVIFDSIDAMGLHFERAAGAARWPLAAAYRAEAARCRKREQMLVENARFTVAVADRDLVALRPPEGRGRVIPVAGSVVEGDASDAPQPVVLLSGNLGYRPTVEGAQWFANEVWPLVHSRVPNSRWVLAGARPVKAIQRLQDLPGVEVHGNVPDLSVYLRSARMAIAPMSSGSGVPMKVLEAMAAAVPVVVHPWAAEGLTVGADEAVLVAEGPEAWVEATVGLLTDSEAALQVGRRGHAQWRRCYSPQIVAEQIRGVVAEAQS